MILNNITICYSLLKTERVVLGCQASMVWGHPHMGSTPLTGSAMVKMCVAPKRTFPLNIRQHKNGRTHTESKDLSGD